MIKVAIADDHKLVREAWSMLLKRDPRLDIIAVCESGAQAIDVCKTLKPDVVLMDINMEPLNGIETTKSIRLFSKDIKVIGISVHTDLPYINALMQAGADGYVTKNSSGEEMIKAIFIVLEGKQYFCKELSEILPKEHEF